MSLTQKIDIAIERTKNSRLRSVDFNNLSFGAVFSDHMFSAECLDGKWQQPQVIPYGPISLAPATSALHYGQSIFEGFKVFRQTDGGIAVFRMDANLARFNRSAERLAMPQIPTELFIEGASELFRVDQEWVPRQEGGSLYVRPLFFATDDVIYVRPSKNYRLIVMACPVGQYFGESLRLIAEENFVRAFPGGTGFTKAAGNYAGSLLAARKAQENGFHSVLWLDGSQHKFVEEGGVMNVFFMVDGVAVTPPLGGTILPGVTRDSVITLLREMGTKVEERPIGIDELMEASRTGKLSEAFAAGTAATVNPIASIRYRDSDISIPVDKNSSVAARLLTTLNAIRTGASPDKYGWLLKL